jgi:mannose-6-phosphate isomerase-like protein (cupin superfamily)
MIHEPINFSEKLSKFTEHWSPKIIAQLNDYHLKLAKVQGEFVWHDHSDTDEVFIVLKGHLDILFRDGKVSLDEGEMFVVPKGVKHKPVAANECRIMLIEPAGLVNTGSAAYSKLTAPNDVWI